VEGRLQTKRGGATATRAKMSTVRVQREFVMHLHRPGKLHLLSLLPDNRAQLGWLLASTNNFLKVWRKQLASSGLFIKEEETKGGDLTPFFFKGWRN
jgi:hypothetical protein